jgi:Golgi phosphoprotein 3 (GPP34)
VTAWRDVPISIADDLFLLALDDRTGQPRLQPKVLSLGLAGALLAELNLLDHITFTNGQIKVPSGANLPLAAHHRQMCDQLVAEPDHPIATWLSFFAQSSMDVIGGRLVARGFLRLETSRSVLRSKQSYQATDESGLAWRTFRVATLIAKRDIRNWEDGLLVGLLAATGLVDHVMQHGPPEELRNVPDIVESVSADPFFRTLLTQVSALVATALAAQRK